MEVYNEKVRDLLNVDKNDLKVYETQEGNISTDCSLEMVNCAEQMVHLLNQGNKNKSIGETQMNDRSSRSHTIFRIVSVTKYVISHSCKFFLLCRQSKAKGKVKMVLHECRKSTWSILPGPREHLKQAQLAKDIKKGVPSTSPCCSLEMWFKN